MKKLISAVAAGAILLSVAGVALARGVELTNEDTSVKINALSLSNSGLNKQTGSGSKSLRTGDSFAITSVTSIANQNATGSLRRHSSVELENEDTKVKINALAISNSGLNLQTSSHSHHATNRLSTGNSEADTVVASWANINLSGVSLE